MTMHADLWTIRKALELIPDECRYHGSDFGRSGREGPLGEPRCDSCKPAWRAMCARDALRRVQESLVGRL